MAITAISPQLPVAERLTLHRRVSSNPEAKFYRPELDLLRFCAFLSVFLHHGLPSIETGHHLGTLAWLFRVFVVTKQAASFGVCLFFLLSSYLITELLQREAMKSGGVNVPSFYIRRILRIWPLYFTFIIVGALLGLFLPIFHIENGRLLAFSLLSGNWYVTFAGCGASSFAPLWSISVEEQFYLLWPWVSKLGGRAAVWRTSVFLLPLSWAAIFWLSRHGVNAGRESWVNSFVQFQFFGLGSLLAISLKGRAPNFRLTMRCALVAAGLLCWLLAQAVCQVKDFDGPLSPASLILGYSFIGIGCISLFLGFLGISPRGIPKPVVYLGKISFGLYVFHMICLEFAWKLQTFQADALGLYGRAFNVALFLLSAAAALLVTIGLAIFSYQFLETPFLRIKKQFSLVESRSI